MLADGTAAVIDVVNRYALAVDSKQWDVFDTIFDVDADVDFGGGARWLGRAALKEAFGTIHAGYDATLHVTTNHVVTINDAIAHCLSYVHGRFFKQVDGGHEFESAGWYDDQLQLVDGQWWITHRTCRMVWSRGNPRVMGAEAAPIDMSQATVIGSLHRAAKAGRIGYLRYHAAAATSAAEPTDAQ
jgi:hypothetical protein